jgi:predicted nuclease with TOPRIM domain
MENQENKENQQNENDNYVPQVQKSAKTFKGLTVLLVILVIALGATIVVLFNKINDQKEQFTEVQDILEGEKQSLQKELNGLIGEYDALKTNNDSLNKQISGQQEKIKKLLTIQATNVELITKYKKELVTLRDVLKSYIAQVDSLNTRNQQLVTENTEVKTRLDQARTENLEKTTKIDELSSQVEKGSIIAIGNLVVTPLNKRGKEEDNAVKILKVKVCFTMRENKLASAGSKDVFIRIMRPDGAVIAYSDADLFNFEGQQIVYSARRQIEYENKDLDVCIFWDNNNQLAMATYTVDIFTDGHLIGTTSFTIKKK